MGAARGFGLGFRAGSAAGLGGGFRRRPPALLVGRCSVSRPSGPPSPPAPPSRAAVASGGGVAVSGVARPWRDASGGEPPEGVGRCRARRRLAVVERHVAAVCAAIGRGRLALRTLVNGAASTAAASVRGWRSLAAAPRVASGARELDHDLLQGVPGRRRRHACAAWVLGQQPRRPSSKALGSMSGLISVSGGIRSLTWRIRIAIGASQSWNGTRPDRSSIRDHADRVEVGPRPDLLTPSPARAPCTLGVPIVRPGGGQELAAAGALGGLGDPEVRDLRAAVRRDQQVLGLEVAVHDAVTTPRGRDRPARPPARRRSAPWSAARRAGAASPAGGTPSRCTDVPSARSTRTRSRCSGGSASRRAATRGGTWR